MTEEEWLASADPQAMLEFLRGEGSKRKFRLFGVACGRQIWQLLRSKRSERAVEIGELFADGLVTQKDLVAASRAAAIAGMEMQQSARHLDYGSTIYPNRVAPAWAARASALSSAWRAAAESSQFAMKASEPVPPDVQHFLLHDIFGNPFRPISINPTWLTPTVSNLATSAYEERALPSGELDSARLAILADALEDSGCDNGAILGHLRSPRPHVRGCHVLDLLLGKE